ncbi:hypothetical protein OF897_00165 [Chryseobacterium formosus]|uniref:Uncharacterized protein n=1 Tax=Chryseobacterium formosus TaxID=1537363 RepID=A0ABT3XJL9_9FLAO|nr:hypothetical protein [Chryseobacterium formosus]MCX8522335.1 hypothetical protein [Chryseobacterium formosus]
MKRFLFKISFYIIGIVAVLLSLGTFADGNTDDNYMHYTGTKPSSMILGDSRGVQAVVPDVLDSKLGKDKRFNNFAFSIAESPYGKVYLEAVKKKINQETKKGIFILTVDPWSLSLDKDIKNEAEYPEMKSALADMHFYDKSPNYEYLIKHYPRSWFYIYKEREAVAKSNTYLHKDGWMEVTVNVHPDTVVIREGKKIKEYEELVKVQRHSQERLTSFKEMIDFLKTKGTVYVVRIPASERMMEIETYYWADFSKTINEISEKQNVKFFDFSPQAKNYIYTDGNHMYKESGKIFTAQIADSILVSQKNLK